MFSGDEKAIGVDIEQPMYTGPTVDRRLRRHCVSREVSTASCQSFALALQVFPAGKAEKLLSVVDRLLVTILRGAVKRNVPESISLFELRCLASARNLGGNSILTGWRRRCGVQIRVTGLGAISPIFDLRLEAFIDVFWKPTSDILDSRPPRW